MVISIDDTNDCCAIIGKYCDWQVLWNDTDRNQSLIGMTEKMHDQLVWACRYITRYEPSANVEERLKFECYKRASPDSVLLYTLIRRRLNDNLTDPCFYTLQIPRPLPPVTKHDLIKDLVIKLTRYPRKKRIRVDIFYKDYD